MKELQFTLTVEETNTILNALGNQPYISVSGLINKLQQQANAQLSDETMKVAAAKAKSESDVKN